jgi:hypothetical protein
MTAHVINNHFHDDVSKSVGGYISFFDDDFSQNNTFYYKTQFFHLIYPNDCSFSAKTYCECFLSKVTSKYKDHNELFNYLKNNLSIDIFQSTETIEIIICVPINQLNKNMYFKYEQKNPTIKKIQKESQYFKLLTQLKTNFRYKTIGKFFYFDNENIFIGKQSYIQLL